MEFTREELKTIYMVFKSDAFAPIYIVKKIEEKYTQCNFCGELFLHEEIDHHRATSTCNDDED